MFVRAVKIYPHRQIGNAIGVVGDRINGELRSSMGYTRIATIEEIRSKSEFITVTAAGMNESHSDKVLLGRVDSSVFDVLLRRAIVDQLVREFFNGIAGYLYQF